MTSAAGAAVTLINGASAHNVFWHVVGATALTAPTLFQGTVIADGAMSLGDGVVITGQALSVLGAVTLYNNALSVSPRAPLPVELTHFAAVSGARGPVLSWATASEKNNDRFEVQRSAGGRTFQLLGAVKGQGSSTHEYAFADNLPVAGLAYYRLRQVHTDGTGTFSPVATARWQPLALAAYPNPSAGRLPLPAGSGQLHYRVFDNKAGAVQQGEVGNHGLDLAPLAPGIYLLELSGDAGRSLQRVVRE